MTKPIGYRPLLTIEADAKTIKGSKRGYLTGILYLAPATESGVANVCTSSNTECRRLCLFNSGRARAFPAIKRARIRKTRLLYRDRARFLESLRYDIRKLEARARKRRMVPCVRLNGTSDLPWLARQMAREFPSIQFYDYTKHARAWERVLPNYYLLYSHSGTNAQECLNALKHGINVCVVFDGELPATWNGYRVIDGDTSDLRFLDPSPCVVGVRVKRTGASYQSAPTGKFFVSVQALAGNSIAA